MIVLNTTTRKLQVVLSGAITTNQLPVTVVFKEIRTDNLKESYGEEVKNTNSTTAVDILNAPGSGMLRLIESISVVNEDTAAATVTIRYNDNSTTYTIVKVTLGVGDQLYYEDE
jgi:hypothetical protein